MTTYVYIHKRKDTNEIFYVGKGTGNRLNQKTSRNIKANNLTWRFK